MIHQIVIMSASGMLLYFREFQSVDGLSLKPEFFGAIIVATVDFTSSRTGCSLSYIQLSKIGMAIAHNNVCCCIVTVSRDQGSSSFARLFAHELLDTFQSRYLRNISLAVFSSEQFAGLSADLYEISLQCVRPVLDYLSLLPGVHLALISGGTNNLFYSTKDIDKIGVVASLPRLIEKSNGLFDPDFESMLSMRLSNSESSIHIFKVERSTLILVTRGQDKVREYNAHIQHSLVVLRKVMAVSNFLSG